MERVLNQGTGRMVIDDAQHASWREEYYKKHGEARNEIEEAVRRAVHNKNLGDLNILDVTQVAEYFGCSHTTAYHFMRDGIIPSFQVGRRWYTHDYNIDVIEKRAKMLFDEGYIRRSLPRMVYKYDKGAKW